MFAWRSGSPGVCNYTWSVSIQFSVQVYGQCLQTSMVHKVMGATSVQSALQGNRDNIESMAGGSQKVLGQVLKLIDLYDLYGSVAYPKVGACTSAPCLLLPHAGVCRAAA
jgi:hypothetical protein